MELEEGKTYSTQEMQRFMGISKSTWDHSRDKYLENFCLYYEYEVIYEGRSTNYHILKKLGDYKKPPSKRNKEVRDKTYEEQIVEVIEVDNVQTPKNVARIIGNADAISVELHIVVTYGMNINAIAASITEKVKYAVKEIAGITVDRVTIKIDGIKE